MEAEQGGPADSASTSLGEGALAQSSERYASMFIHHPHAAYSVDRRGYYTDANEPALAMTGLSLQQMRQSHYSQVIHPDDLHIIDAAFHRALTGVPQLSEARVLRPDREVIDIRCTMIPVVVGGEVVGVHGIAEDVTRAKEMVRQLEEANAAKSLFLATVSHEVRTPLAALVGATDLLLDAGLGPEQEHYVRMVHRSSQRLMHLVNDLLEYSGLEAHQNVVHPRPFEVRSVVEDVAAWAVPFAASRDLTMSFAVDEAVPAKAVGDARRITQVLTNLVQNALKFTERGGVEVRVRARPIAPDERPDDRVTGGCEDSTGVEFAVADTGIGIADDHLSTLFEPFTQVDPHAAREHRGVGLGLAICRALVDLLGGRLQVESTLGQGSTFTFGVPLGRLERDATDAP
ncbi:HAMP domain-containing sensor histidine kinase [Nocardioides sp. SYSU D00065]|uniref:sensor histidine kinase n=1 Tax=Nocardioides sp. SYSU D00065 TaxID=2817378 RepID=UPI001B33FA04|nr:PAS domain-containing protein [Nocardioides sp. SYSU D00065]